MVWRSGDRETVEEIGEDISHTMPETDVFCIDTSCGNDGKLTVMIIEGREYLLQSAAEEWDCRK